MRFSTPVNSMSRANGDKVRQTSGLRIHPQDRLNRERDLSVRCFPFPNKRVELITGGDTGIVISGAKISNISSAIDLYRLNRLQCGGRCHRREWRYRRYRCFECPNTKGPPRSWRRCYRPMPTSRSLTSRLITPVPRSLLSTVPSPNCPTELSPQQLNRDSSKRFAIPVYVFVALDGTAVKITRMIRINVVPILRTASVHDSTRKIGKDLICYTHLLAAVVPHAPVLILWFSYTSHAESEQANANRQPLVS